MQRVLEDTLVDLRKQGRTILFSTHRMDQVEKLCDNICLVDKGKAVLSGNLREIKKRQGHNRVQIAFDGREDDEDPDLLGSPGGQQSRLDDRIALLEDFGRRDDLLLQINQQLSC